MAKSTQASRTRAATAKAPAAKTATAELVEETPAASEPAAKPPVALVPDEPAAPAKRRGRPPGAKAKTETKKPRKGKAAARPEILFLVETEEESGQFENQGVSSVSELLDLMDENRKVFATRQWREF